MSFAPLLLLLFLATAAPPARGQQAYRIAETLDARCDLSEVWPVNDLGEDVLRVIAGRPEAKVAVVVHGRPGDAIRYARKVRLWMSERRGVAAGRLVDGYGGPAGKRRLDLWLVPPGASPPVAPPVAENRVTLFDSYTYWEGEGLCEADRPPALSLFAETLERLPGWRGTIVVRPHVNPRIARDDQDFDGYSLTRRQALRRAAEDRLRLVRQLGVDPSRIRAVVGERAAWAHTELWLVPPAAAGRPGGAADVR